MAISYSHLKMGKQRLTEAKLLIHDLAAIKCHSQNSSSRVNVFPLCHLPIFLEERGRHNLWFMLLLHKPGAQEGSVHVWLISCLTGCRAGLDLLVSWWFSAFPPVPLGLVFLCLSICPQASFPIWSICYEKVSAWALFSMHMAFLFKMQRQSWGGWWSLSCTSDSHMML